MWRIIKLLIYATILAAFGLVAYAYVGPFLGADFIPPQETVTIPVELDLD
ncbi:MAG: hypothetical protein AAF841_09990 [Pseudomonadota bacterium]